MDCGPAENHTFTADPLATLEPASGLILVQVPSGSVESVSCFSVIFKPNLSSLSLMLSLDVEALHASGMVTVSSEDLLPEPFMANMMPTMTSTATIAAIAEPMMIFLRFLALAAAARCCARDCNAAELAPLAGGICSN